MYPENNNEESIRRFFRDPFSNEYSRYCSETVIAAVSQINAALEYAAELMPASKRKLLEEIMRSVSKQTSQLMRVASVSRTLSDSSPAEETVDVDALLAFLCEQFAKRLSERYTFRLRSVCHAYVLSDSRIISELILGAVRKMSLSRRTEHAAFHLGADVIGKNVRIYVTDVTEDDPGAPSTEKPDAGDEFFDRFFGEAHLIIAELIGAGGGYGSGLYTIELPKYEPEDSAQLRSPIIYDTSDCAYSCEIMLNDDKL